MSTVQKHYDEEEEIGFRFLPSDEELIVFYLQPKVAKEPNKYFELEDKDEVYKIEPWRLVHNETDFFKSNEWFYFVTRAQVSVKYTGKHTKRIVKGETCQGYWKANEKSKDIVWENTGEVIGKRRSLSFYVKDINKASGWTMIEYSLIGESFQNQVLCHLKAP